MNFPLLLATKNSGKIRELKELLADLPITLQSAADYPELPEPEETGATFAENAVLKAQYYAQKTGLPALADDSGLEVEALNGNPGVLSARYGGEKATNDEKIDKLLNELSSTQSKNRSARFVCSMAIADNDGKVVFLTEGICQGILATAAKGNNGFGYDPVFIPEGFNQTFGELTSEIKQRISHRSRAIGKIIEYLHDFSVS